MIYFKKITGLRGVAILLVLLQHFPPWIGHFFSAGYYGVDLFFVISGFLITGILYNSEEPNFLKAYGRFLGRRTLRIFPIYYLTVGILYLLNFKIIKDYIFWFLTYTYNYAWTKYNIPISDVHHFWSLCVEEQFYLFWPLIVLTFRNKPAILIAIIIGIITLGFLQKLFNIIPSLSIYNELGLLTRMSSLGMGAFGAIYSSNYKLPERFFRSKTVEYVLLLIILPVCLVCNFELKVVLLASISLYLVLKAAYFDFLIPRLEGLLKNKKVLYIASISYGIYIFHVPLVNYFNQYFLRAFWNSINFKFWPLLKWHSWIVKLPLYYFITIGFASLSYRYVEKPILSLKDKLFRYKFKTDNREVPGYL